MTKSSANILSVIQRYIQEASNTSLLEPHWGYVNRILPCTNDIGSCEYLVSAGGGGHE
jgi:ferric-chelate reductase